MIKEHHALNPLEVQTIASIPIRVVRYRDLSKYKSIEDLFGKIKGVLVLYESKINSGHWCCLINQPKKVVFFDPYALEPDDQLQFANIRFRKENNMHLPYLTYLLFKSKKKIDYNDEQLQVMDENIETCGYWCGLRMRLHKLTSDEFKNIFKNVPLTERDNLIIEICDII